MSWNRPSEGKVKVKGEGEQRNVHLKGLVAGAIVVVGAGLAAWWLWPVGERAGETPPPQKEGLIKEVKPAVVRRPAAPKPVTAVADTTSMPTRVGELRNGYRLLPNGHLHKVVGIATSHVARVTLADRIFPDECDAELGNLLLIEPGASFLGDSKDYYTHFDRSLREALKTPIRISPDDPDDVRELKEGVIALREELKEKMDRGEDVNQVMRDTREQYRQLGLYREELEAEVDRVMRESETLTEKDLADLIGAANKMLEERGIKPFVLDSSLKHRLRTYSRQKKGKRK